MDTKYAKTTKITLIKKLAQSVNGIPYQLGSDSLKGIIIELNVMITKPRAIRSSRSKRRFRFEFDIFKI